MASVGRRDGTIGAHLATTTTVEEAVHSLSSPTGGTCLPWWVRKCRSAAFTPLQRGMVRRPLQESTRLEETTVRRRERRAPKMSGAGSKLFALFGGVRHDLMRPH